MKGSDIDYEELLTQERASFFDKHKDASTISSRDPNILVQISGEQPRLCIVPWQSELQRWLARYGSRHRRSRVLYRCKQPSDRSKINLLSKKLSVLRDLDRIRQLRSPDHTFLELNLDAFGAPDFEFGVGADRGRSQRTSEQNRVLDREEV